MPRLRALIADPSAPAALRLAEVAEPVVGPGQVLLEVHHASLNRGDLNDARSGRVAPGGVLGSDAAGVARAAADGTGPAAGTRVVALTPGAFAQRVAVEVGAELATLVRLVAAGWLAVQIGWRGPWQQVTEAAEALLGRRVSGKAVLDVRPAVG